MKQKGVVHIGLIVLLLIAIATGVYLVQKEGFFKFKSKAYIAESLEGLELQDANGNPLECDSSTNPPTCITETLDIKVRVKGKDAFTPTELIPQTPENQDNGSP